MISLKAPVQLSFASPLFNFRVNSEPSVCFRRSYFRCTATLRGYSSIYSGDGTFVEEKAVSLLIAPEESTLVSSAKPGSPHTYPDNSAVVFHSGAVSRGPPLLALGNFELDAVLPTTEGVRLVVGITYISGERKSIQLSLVSEKGEQAFGRNPPLDGRDIAGDWEGDNYRWSANAPPSLMRALPRNYSSRNSPSSMLVRLPLGVSIVAPQSWKQGSSAFSFGTGWLPNQNSRPVMIRSHSADGRLEKVDWRLETRLI